MNDTIVTSAQYVADSRDGGNMCIISVIDGKELIVPLDPANRHYQAIQEWVAEGNTIQEAE